MMLRPAFPSQLLAGFLSLVALLSGGAADHPNARLSVSKNGRYLVQSNGKPFFYLGDTAWELFHRLNREEATQYLEDRAAKGFTVIQAVVLAELDGLHTPNAYGHTPLKNDDPTQPNEDYFKHVDYIVKKANDLGLMIGMLPTWGDKWNKAWGAGPTVFSAQNAEAYGEWLGRRYKSAALIWILGGDRAVENDSQKEIIRRMAAGLGRGDGGSHLMTFHPTGGQSSSKWFHDDPWLSFNMRQNGHEISFNGRYDQTRTDYDRSPTKPVIDGEPVYEDHPVAFDAKKNGHTIAADVRRPLYWDLFSGACGHTYGHHSVWQMYDPKKAPPVNNPLLPWHQAINQPGAAQMRFGRQLLESRPFLTRVPDDSVIVPDQVATSVPGAGTRRFVATRDESGSFAMIYAPISRPFKARLNAISGAKVKAWWFNPRNGQATAIGTFANTEAREFTPPDLGESLDWVLVLDDAAKNYPPPGKR
jgi:hypothetical protein